MKAFVMYHGCRNIKKEESLGASQTPCSSAKHRSKKGSMARANTAGQASSTFDQESKNRNQNRRRIPLACTRCRKRKIKCSGSSDGGPCQNCRNASTEDCQFLRPDTAPALLLPIPGSGLAFPYPSPTSLMASVSSDSFGARSHQQATLSSASSSLMHTVPYFRSQSLSDLGNYHRHDSLQRESPYGNNGNGQVEEMYNTPHSLHSQSCLPTKYASDATTDYYGALSVSKAWNQNVAAATAIAADLARSQSAVFYTTEIPTLFPDVNLMSSADFFMNRALPVPTSSSPLSVNIDNVTNTTYFREDGMPPAAATNLFLIPGEEEPANIHSTTSPKSVSPSVETATKRKSFAGTLTCVADDKSNMMASSSSSSSLHHYYNHHQDYMVHYSDDSLNTFPITPMSTYIRSGTTDSSSTDAEEPVMISMNGLKNVPSEEEDHKNQVEVFNHDQNSSLGDMYARNPQTRRGRWISSSSHVNSHSNNINGNAGIFGLLQSSSIVHSMPLDQIHQRY